MKRKYLKKFLALGMVSSMIFSLITGCTKEKEAVTLTAAEEMIKLNESNPLNIVDDKYGTFYEVFVYSFCDSDGDGVGDIQGLISKLDYINDGDSSTTTDLNCNGIWLMPVNPSPTYHKYDVTDYYGIDEEYGTLDDFKELIEECHKRGIKVIMDMVMNHSSSEHPYFKTAVEYLKTLMGDEEPDPTVCPEVSYYNFTKTALSGYSNVSGTDWYYEARFWSGMPDFNLDNEAVKQEFKDIAAYWLDMGVDGFRMDAVTSYYTGADDSNIEALAWFNDAVKEINPDAYIVAECWTDYTTYAKYYKSGIDSLFDFDFSNNSGTIAKVVNGRSSAYAYANAIISHEELYASYSSSYINAPFYSNHDMGRSAGYYAGDTAEAKTKLGAALNILMSGNVFIYYGEELGMKGSGIDENKRGAMYWSKDEDAEGMCDGPENIEDIEQKYDSYEEQSESNESIYTYYKQAIRLRNSFPVIGRGTTTLLEDISSKTICAYTKTSDDYDSVLIIFNTGTEEETIDLSAYTDEYSTLCGMLITGDTAATLKDNTLTLPSYGLVILTK